MLSYTASSNMLRCLQSLGITWCTFHWCPGVGMYLYFDLSLKVHWEMKESPFFTVCDLTKNLHATSLLLYPLGPFLFQYDFMSFSIKSHSTLLSRAWVTHWGSADSEPVASVVQMMALLWGQEPLHAAPLWTPALFPTWQHVFELGLQPETELSAPQPYESKIQPALGVCCQREKYRRHIPRYVIVLFLGLKSIVQICTQGVFNLWHVETCVLPPLSYNGCEGCVRRSVSAVLWSWWFHWLCHFFWSNMKTEIEVVRFTAKCSLQKLDFVHSFPSRITGNLCFCFFFVTQIVLVWVTLVTLTWRQTHCLCSAFLIWNMRCCICGWLWRLPHKSCRCLAGYFLAPFLCLTRTTL